MDADEHNANCNFQVGDIVTEIDYIVDPARSPWTGIVVYVDKEHFELHSYIGQYEDLVGVHWFKPGITEELPASVLSLIQKA